MRDVPPARIFIVTSLIELSWTCPLAFKRLAERFRDNEPVGETYTDAVFEQLREAIGKNRRAWLHAEMKKLLELLEDAVLPDKVANEVITALEGRPLSDLARVIELLDTERVKE